jgi:predicted nucleotidyltransferase
MSGNFTQRGDAAVLSKHKRAYIALHAEADAVVHLPTAFSCCSAEVFALAACVIANSFKNVTHLCFGSECGDIWPLLDAAEFFRDEPKAYSQKLKAFLLEGQSYNSARLKALESTENTNIMQTVSSPNNILGVEYIKALKILKSAITPITVRRQTETVSENKVTTFASSTTIRNELYKSNNPKSTAAAMPKPIFKLFKQEIEKQGILNIKLFDQLKLNSLRLIKPEQLQQVFDVNEGLENRLITLSRTSPDFMSFMKSTLTKRYSERKINRIAIGSMTGINKDIIKELYRTLKLPYIKLLAAKKSVLPYLECSVPFITRSSETKDLSCAISEIEERADALYTQLNNLKTVNVPYLMQQPVII